MTIVFNSVDITTPSADKSWGLYQVDDGKPKLRGENYVASEQNGRTHVNKLKDEKKITLYMWAKTEDALNYLMNTVFDDGLKAMTYTIGSDTKNWNGECTDFRHTNVVADLIKIVVEITIPQPL